MMSDVVQILELRRPELGRQAVAAAARAVLEQERAVHADQRRDLQIGEEGSVRHQPRIVAAVAEAALAALGHEAHHARLAGLHRPVERIDAVTERLVLIFEARAGKVDPVLRELVVGADVHLRDDRFGEVGQGVAAMDHGVDPARIEGDVQRDPADRRLRQLFIFEIFLLVIGEELLLVAARPVMVEDVRIVEDPDSGCDERDERNSADDPRAAVQPMRNSA
jgi:hypothetical protein